MSLHIVDVVLRGTALAFYVGAGVVSGLLAVSGPSLDVLDALSSFASAYGCGRPAGALRTFVDMTFAEVHA